MAKQKYTKEFLEPIIQSSKSYAEVLRTLDISFSGSNNSYIRTLVKRYDIDVSHFLGKSINKDKEAFNKLDAQSILVLDRYNGRREKAHRLRRALIELGVEEKCSICNIPPEWNSKKLILQIDHINGNGLDNRKENLRFLCPNCHSQTETFGVKNIKNEI